MSEVTQFSKLGSKNTEKQSPITMDEVFTELQQWRSSKKSVNATIPDSLWEKIFHLADIYSASKIKALMGLSHSQYSRKSEQFRPKILSKPSGQTQTTSADFCEVKTDKPVYQSLKIPATHTIVVEFRRSDGQIMKIHTTSENFKTLINLFFEMGHHASDHL